MKKIFITLLLITFLLPLQSFAMRNPATVYCFALGYKMRIVNTPLGQQGLCVLPDGKTVSQWKFLKGEQAEEYNYCSIKGFNSIKGNGAICNTILSSNCNVCIDGLGRKVEAFNFMRKEGELPSLDDDADFILKPLIFCYNGYKIEKLRDVVISGGRMQKSMEQAINDIEKSGKKGNQCISIARKYYLCLSTGKVATTHERYLNKTKCRENVQQYRTSGEEQTKDNECYFDINAALSACK